MSTTTDNLSAASAALKAAAASLDACLTALASPVNPDFSLAAIEPAPIGTVSLGMVERANNLKFMADGLAALANQQPPKSLPTSGTVP